MHQGAGSSVAPHEPAEGATPALLHVCAEQLREELAQLTVRSASKRDEPLGKCGRRKAGGPRPTDEGARDDVHEPLVGLTTRGGLSNYDPSNNTLRVSGYSQVPSNLGVFQAACVAVLTGAYGVSSAALSKFLESSLSGSLVSTYREDNELIEILLRGPAEGDDVFLVADGDRTEAPRAELALQLRIDAGIGRVHDHDAVLDHELHRLVVARDIDPQRGAREHICGDSELSQRFSRAFRRVNVQDQARAPSRGRCRPARRRWSW